MNDVVRSVAALRRFVREPQRALAQCDLCAASLVEDHEHLYEPAPRRLVCACGACAAVFPNDAAAKYRRIVPRATPLDGLALGDAELDALGIPVRLAFFCPSEVHDSVFAILPNLAGATETSIPGDTWAQVTLGHVELRAIAPEVEALVIDARDGRRRACIVSVDVCLRLVGRLREGGPRPSSARELERSLDAIFAGRTDV